MSWVWGGCSKAVFMSNMAQAELTYQWPHLESAGGVPGIVPEVHLDCL